MSIGFVGFGLTSKKLRVFEVQGLNYKENSSHISPWPKKKTIERTLANRTQVMKPFAPENQLTNVHWKTENGSNRNAQAHRENVLCPKAPTENGSRGKKERLTWGVHMSGLKDLAGARRLRWSPASNHGESGRSECTKRFSMSFRIGGWWTWSSGSTTSMATLSPADGGSGDG